MTEKHIPPDVSLCEHCPLNMTVQYTIAAHERRIQILEKDIKELLSVAAQFKLLLSLSIGGGGLSLITLILTIIRLATNGSP